MKLNFLPNSLKNFDKKALFDRGLTFDQFPSKKLENWKFTDLNRILNFKFKELNILNEKKTFEPKEKLDFEHNSIVTVNGDVSNYDFGNGNKKFENSSDSASKKIILKVNKNHPFANSIGEANNDSLLANNIAFSDRGINLECLSDIQTPLVIYNFFVGDLENKFINNSNKIKLTNSKTTIIEYNIDNSECNFFRNTFQMFDLDNSELDYFVINNKISNSYNYIRNSIKINKSKYKNYIFTSGVKFKKEDNDIFLNSENSSTEIYSASVLKKDEHQEVQSTIRHMAPNCKSLQKIKTILKDSSKGIFQGKIYVDKKAQKTDAYQMSKGLMLDNDSEFTTKPELEIYADDVKCSHGSTSGNIDEQALYYLMSRGISRKKATQLIIKGFLEDVISEIRTTNLKILVESHLEKSL